MIALQPKQVVANVLQSWDWSVNHSHTKSGRPILVSSACRPGPSVLSRLELKKRQLLKELAEVEKMNEAEKRHPVDWGGGRFDTTELWNSPSDHKQMAIVLAIHFIVLPNRNRSVGVTESFLQESPLPRGFENRHLDNEPSSRS